MDPQLCRSVNIMTMELIAKYFDVPVKDVNHLYQELLDDTQFLDEINEQIDHIRSQGHKKGLFSRGSLDTPDWFGVQRILIYIVTRLKKPDVCVETGVFYGGNTAFFLNALRKNGKGHLISVDLPGNLVLPDNKHQFVGDSEILPQNLDTGFLIHNNLKKNWNLVRGDSHQELPRLNEKVGIFMHDSDHSYEFVKKELSLIWKNLTHDAVIMVDDLDWSNGFFSFVDEKRLFPLVVTDNGKSGLAARTGVARLDHPFNHKSDVVGREH